MCLVNAVVILLSLVECYQSVGDERDRQGTGQRGLLSVEREREMFLLSEVCGNRSEIEVCGDGEVGEVRTLNQLKRSNCRCDDHCFEYGDCCIDKVLSRRSGALRSSDGLTATSREISRTQSWTCREVRTSNESMVEIYVYQKCSTDWEDDFIRGMCEIEAIVREKMRLDFDHLQDIPVIGETTRKFYRNVYCAICNHDVQLYKMDSRIYCNGDSTDSFNRQDRNLDFTNAVYHPRTMMYRKVKVGKKLKNCHIRVDNFKLSRLVPEYGARLCKPIVDVCPINTSIETQQKCKDYSSYVYQDTAVLSKRKVYKNFHCAQCNGIPAENLSCYDLYGLIVRRTDESSLSILFDFNFRGGSGSIGRRNSCLMSEGQMWDPIYGRCRNVTCGSMHKREKFQCIPLNESDLVTGMKNTCLKIILDSYEFALMSNGSVYINKTMQILSPEEFEVHSTENKVVVKIAVCLDSSLHLLPYSKAHSWLSVITLSISITCLILHLVVYSLLEKLRNCPGKVLMSLSASLLIGHIFLLLGPHFMSTFWMCYINGVATHFGYLSAFSWMSVMAFDIHGTFSVTQSHNTRKQKAFVRYSLYAWLSSLTAVVFSVVIDNSLYSNSDIRPKYGDPICWFNNRKGLLVFFVVPATILLIANISLFAVTAFHIRKVSRQTKMVNNFSDKVRYYLYLKLAVVLGLTWILGLIAGITQMDAFWYPFIVLNGLQGALIFLSFTIKRSILHMLAVKLKLRSDKYRIGKPSGIKAAMYSSLSNLTLQTTTSSQIPSLSEKKDMLKSFRKINPDAVVEHRNV